MTTRPIADFVASRTPNKDDERDILAYEIGMLNHTMRRMVEANAALEAGAPNAPTADDMNMMIESYLLHYRNLLAFFLVNYRAKEGGSPGYTGMLKDTDVRIDRPDGWRRGAKIDDTERAKLHEDAKPLAALFNAISEMLQHITTHRLKPKEWKLGEMHNALGGLIVRFDKLLRH